MLKISKRSLINEYLFTGLWSNEIEHAYHYITKKEDQEGFYIDYCAVKGMFDEKNAFKFIY